MGFSKNISFSILLHLLLIAGVFANYSARSKNLNPPFFVTIKEETTGLSGEKPMKNPDKTVSPSGGITFPKETEPSIAKSHLLLQGLKKEDAQITGTGPSSQSNNELASKSISLFNSETPQGNTGGVTGSLPDKTTSVSRKGTGDIVRNSDNINFIRSAIQKNLIYPFTAKKRNIEGTVLTEFSINNSGIPVNIKIIKSSGFNVLDSAAVQTIPKASPFPVLKGDIEIPITFVLRK